ncbi:hypothetical protein BUALT_Bualt08G0039900 [Buddleja alternifolia]|uniref:Cytochrome P450 n=1 Tax=Buddleja alternifolia TaxID=168488 RepID=A0AAV6XEF6_9LAMI|nr:hypothetical protein BUALT_Bualt08G0039900 [Buddleja alternifolia]
MEFLYFILFLLLLPFLYLFVPIFHRKFKEFPPSPPLSIPIIGHLYLIRKPLHRTLAKISNKYGPILLLQFGSRPVVVVSSPSAAEECLTKNDMVFANRPQLLAGKHLGYNYTTLTWAPYGDHWRNLRRIASLEILSTHRILMFADVRRNEVDSLVKGLLTSEDKCKVVDMKSAFFEVMQNIMTRMIGGKRYYDDDDDSENLDERRRVKVLKEKRDKFMQDLIDEHRKLDLGGEGKRNKTLIDVLLSLQQTDPKCYTDEIIKGMMQSGSKMMNQEVVKLNCFDGTNYPRWKDKMMFLLTFLKIAYVLDPNQPATEPRVDDSDEVKAARVKRGEDEVLCRGHILNTLSDRLFDLYSSIKSPLEIWNALEQKYNNEKQGTDKFLTMKYFEFSMRDESSIMDQVHEIQIYVSKLKDLKIEIPEAIQVGAIIAKLPVSWNNYRKKLLHSTEDFSVDQLLKHLRIEEETRIRDKMHQVQTGSKVNFVSEKKKNWNPNGGGNKKSFPRMIPTRKRMSRVIIVARKGISKEIVVSERSKRRKNTQNSSD